MRFGLRCNARDWRRSAIAKHALLQDSRDRIQDWVGRFGLACEFAESGEDYVFRNPQGLEENRTVAKQGGTVAGNARKEIEAQTGRPVVTAENASTMLLGQAVAGMIEGVVKDEDDKE